jgi:hypothetical protein
LHELNSGAADDGTARPASEGAADGNSASAPEQSRSAQAREAHAGSVRAEGSAGSPSLQKIFDALNGGRPGIFRVHGEFKGAPMEFCTDGTRLVPGSRVHGENVVGKQPDRSPADVRELPPNGPKLLELANEGLPKSSRLLAEAKEGDDLPDGLKTTIDATQDIFRHPPPPSFPGTKVADLPNVVAAGLPALGTGDAFVSSAIAVVAVSEGIRWIRERHIS